MAKTTEKQIAARNSKRDIGAELLQAVREMKAGKAARSHREKVPKIAEARTQAGLSQQQFATVLGLSLRTFERWDQGRRKPAGAARSLLAIATDVTPMSFACYSPNSRALRTDGNQLTNNDSSRKSC